MKNLPKIAVTLLGLIFCFDIFAQDLIPPFPVDPFYDSWSFYDPTNWLSDEGYAPNTFTNIINDGSCWSSDDGILDCNGLILDSTNATAFLNYKTVEDDGHTNLSCTAGTIWFWFSPDWDSESQGGSGPGDWGRFIDVGAYTTNAAFGWWSLLLSPDGNNIYFSGQTNGAGTNYLNAPISWTAGSWHLIGLTYTATNSILYIDDQVATNGIGVIYPPRHDVLTNGFWIGSDFSGTQQAHGEFVDVESWLTLFPGSEFSAYYDEMLPELPGSFGGGFADSFGGVGGFSGGGSSSGGIPSYVDGTNLWLQITGTTNTGTTQTAYFTIWPPAGVTNGVFDLFYTTNLANDVPGLSGTNWAWVLRCGAGETNLTVTNLTADNNFFRLGLTNDTDGDGLSDAFEMLVSHTDPNNADQNTNGIPDGWEWNYFGNLNQTAGGDYDGDGYNNGQEYTNGTDPNKIQFALQFTNNYVNTNVANGAVTILGGVPSYYAVVVNDTNLAGADWQPYISSNVVVTLGATNGVYDVFVGLRGLATNSWATWQLAQLTLNTTVPAFTITNPASSTVSVPIIQLQGLVDESLGSLTFDVSNATGIFTNQPGYFNPAFYDTNQIEFTTNSFQCYDIALTNGLNTITLHATDLAGNTTTTNVSYTLDYSSNTNAPVLTLLWPTNGTTIGGSNFTLQAQVDDPTASVTVSIVDTNDDTNIVSALVERSGQVWVNGLPLGGGTNSVTVMATNAAGYASTTNFNVIGNDVGLTITPLTSDQMNQASVIVTGSIGDPSDNVTVNGVAAYAIDDVGGWEADGVPVSASGTATLDVEVTDSGSNPVASQICSQPQPATVQLADSSSFTYSQYIGESIPWVGDFFWYEEADQWAEDTGGDSTRQGIVTSDEFGTRFEHIETSLAPGLGGFGPWANLSVSAASFEKFTQAKVEIVPAGQAQVGTTTSYLVHVSALGYSDLLDAFDEPGDVPLAPTTLKVNGQTLVSSSVTNDDGTIDGLALISAPSGARVPLTVTAATANYTFNVTLGKTKEDWQEMVRQEIKQDSLGLDIQNFKAANTFIKNSPYIKAVYAFYGKVYLEQPTEYYWAGLANLAGADVYAGLSDANYIPGLSGFQQTLMQMHLDILNDLGWQFEAYRKGGLQALEEINAVTHDITILDIAPWREIDKGIQQSNSALILQGNQDLLKREQQQILPPGYAILSSFDTTVMSDFASCPVWDPRTSEPYAGRDFDYVMQFVLFDTNPFNIANTTDRWAWVTAPTVGIWDTWLNLSTTDKTNEVSTPLNTRAITYSIFPSSYLIY